MSISRRFSWIPGPNMNGNMTASPWRIDELEKRVLSYALEPTTVKHYIYAKRTEDA